MNRTVDLLLYFVAIICFALAAFGYRTGRRSIDLVAAGLLAWVLVPALDLLNS